MNFNIDPNQLDFSKNNGLIPAIVQDFETRDVLMLAWQNREAVDKTLQTGEMWFYSRSRKSLWHKGETSGNRQQVVDIKIDCDNDTLLYQVKPMGPACHSGEETCFGAKRFSLATLAKIIDDRKQNPSPNSYTVSLLQDEQRILDKIAEESAEVIQAVEKNEGRDAIVWEVSDLFYHVLVLLAKKNIALVQIESHLQKRNKK
jgi:phosphoribosyl-AMP cyclohydrolase / phosphoribosyl-ATP pyrophosphohydrolase